MVDPKNFPARMDRISRSLEGFGVQSKLLEYEDWRREFVAWLQSRLEKEYQVEWNSDISLTHEITEYTKVGLFIKEVLEALGER